MENLKKVLFDEMLQISRDYMGHEHDGCFREELAAEFRALYGVVCRAGLEDEYMAFRMGIEKNGGR